MRILTLILWYFFLKIMWGKFKKQMEKLEEYNGEFIFTFLNKFQKKEIYFNLSEVQGVLFTKIIDKKNAVITFNIYLNDGCVIRLKKTQNCILFLKSCKKNDDELYQKILRSALMGIDISGIIEREIEKLK